MMHGFERREALERVSKIDNEAIREKQRERLRKRLRIWEGDSSTLSAPGEQEEVSQ